MKKYIVPILFLVIVISSSCQNKDDFEAGNPLLESLTQNAMKGTLSGSDYVWEWTYPSEHLSMHIDVYCNGSKLASQDTRDNSFTLSDITANSEYVFVFKLYDGTNFSKGLVIHYKPKN